MTIDKTKNPPLGVSFKGRGTKEELEARIHLLVLQFVPDQHILIHSINYTLHFLEDSPGHPREREIITGCDINVCYTPLSLERYVLEGQNDILSHSSYKVSGTQVSKELKLAVTARWKTPENVDMYLIQQITDNTPAANSPTP